MTNGFELVDKFVRAHDAHDFDALADLCSHDCVLSGPVASVKGRAAIRAAIPVFLEAFSDDSFTVDRLLETDSTLVFQWTYEASHSGTYHGPTGDVPASGSRVKLRGADVFDISGGQIIRYWSYFDNLDLLTQIGASPRP